MGNVISDKNDGYVDIEIIIDADGNVTTKTLKHGGGATCKNTDDAAIHAELLKMENDGLLLLDDKGHTPEYFEEKSKSQFAAKTQGSPFDAAVHSKTKKNKGFGFSA